ncbi:MAG: type II toxin-antitoxin system VapC family toxin [Candidatus Latescibacteria bacterium]|nr:type II toxin-antitoxin system VapC family toxin [Candidatus Latescibacterota bacterium]MXX14070.1 type II toxin-antitoxin system VapC family toxin [Gemmatimonadota bacterium]MYB57089.1 type II toxin-antitoxin system VapC family toxin [Gemmatimonadota bacterium]
MRLLLDTHIFLWLITGDQRLPEVMQRDILNLENAVYLSVISLWEISVKYQLGKLPLPESPENYLSVQRERHMIASLPLDEASVSQLAKLPSTHRDPFDRMLICQALEHHLTIVTVDEMIRAYPVPVY